MPGPAYLGDQGRDAGSQGGGVGTVERCRGLGDTNPAERKLSAGELGPGRERWRQGGIDVDVAKRVLGCRESTDEELAAGADEARVQSVRTITQRVERLRSRLEGTRRPGQVARDEGDLRLGDLAARLVEALAGPEAACGAPEELACPVVVAELGHGDAPQGESWRVVAQRDALEGPEGITDCQRARGRGDEGIHVWEDTFDPGCRSWRSG